MPSETAPDVYDSAVETSPDARYRVFLFNGDARGYGVRGHRRPPLFRPPNGVFSADVAAADDHLDRPLECEFGIGLVYHGANVTEDASEKLAAFVEFAGKPD